MDLPEDTVYIIDGNAMIRRAFHVSTNIKTENVDGETTTGAYIFSRMMISFLEKVRPSYLIVAIDNATSHWARKRLHPGYKAKGESAEEKQLFLAQERIAHQILNAMQIPIVTFPGYEADDCLATLSKKYYDDGRHVVIVSGDKDLVQCMNERVMMYDSKKHQLFDCKAIEEKYGFPPSMSLNVQTLTGDDTDSIPGIKGIGNKTAVKLLKGYGDIPHIYACLNELKPSLRNKFIEYTSQLAITRVLVRLYDSLPLNVDIKPLVIDDAWKERVRLIFQQLGFRSLIGHVEWIKVGEDDVATSGPTCPLCNSKNIKTDDGDEQGGIPTTVYCTDCGWSESC